MRVTCLFPACAVLAALGCSGEPVPAAANLSGTWDFSYVTSSATGATCHGTMTFTISQTDQKFVGFQRGPGSLFCDGLTLNLPNANVQNSTEFDGEMMTSGIASPNEVAFNLLTLKSQDAGTVQQNGLMTGTTTWVLPVKPSGNVTVSGTWSAFKQNQ
jgi:hypothetical protein